MKTTKVLVGLVLAVTLAAGLLGSPGAGRAQPEPGPHYYCHIAAGGDPEILVDLETQFGLDTDVDVGPGDLLCLPAIKTRAGQPPEGTLEAPHTRSFYIDENLPEPIFVNLETQFGYHPNVRVEHASSLVLPVSKEVTFPVQLPPTPLYPEPHYKCYDIWAPGPNEEVLVETQFFPGGVPVVVGDAVTLCLPAGKNGEPIPAVPHGVCYAAWVPGQFALVNLVTQFFDEIGFAEIDVPVLDGLLLCVPAVKEVIEEAPQDPTFSISRYGPSVIPGPIDPADLLIRAPGVPWPPIIAYPCPAFGSPFCLSMGAPWPGDDGNALSLGQDFTLPPPDPANPDAHLFFSVAPFSTGFAGTGVNNETVGCVTGIPEPEADEFGSAAAGSNYQFMDGDGVATCNNPPASALGLLEPPMAGVSDDLDALDPLNQGGTVFPVFVSLDQQSPTIPVWGLSAADILRDVGDGMGISGLYALAAQLGLDPSGDDIDALCINDADGDWFYSPGDTVWFSLTSNSMTLPLIGAGPSDILVAGSVGVLPTIVVPAGNLGLDPWDDELNALKCYEQPEEVLIADKMVENVWLDDGSGYPFPSPFSAPASVPVYEQHVISITSEDLNLGPEVPEDALVAFYADIPPGCYGRWYDDGGAFPSDTYTVGGDPFADPFSPEQLGAVDPAPLTKKTDDPAGLSPFEIDLHFQMAEYYGYFAEEVGPATPITRFFGFHCEEPSTHTFYFCNKIEPKPPYEDPNFPWNHGPWPGNNVACVQYDVDVIAQVDLVIVEMSLTPPSPYTVEPSEEKQITLDETVWNIGFYGPVDALITKELDVPAGCWGDIEGDSAGGGGMAVHTETVPGMYVGTPVHMSETITVRCDATGTYHFTLRKQIEPVDPHVIDTDPEPPRVEDIEVIVEEPAQDPTFSISRNGPSAPMPVDPSDLVVRQPGGAWPPIVVYPCPAFALIACGGPDEVNALSLGQDFTLPPPDPANPSAHLFFSVAPGATGLAGTGVDAEVAGCVPGPPEPEADEFGSAAAGGNYQFFDGDGVASCANPGAPALGLLEPPMAPISDDLDALDPLNFGDTGPPIFVSLDQMSPSLPMFGGSAADIYLDSGGGIWTWYAPAGALGLDTSGPNSDDIDALCIDDADGDNEYSPGDTVWFSLTPGSLSLTIAGDSAADVFAAPFMPGMPVVQAGQLGLLPGAPGADPGDDLNALKCYQEPVPEEQDPSLSLHRNSPTLFLIPPAPPFIVPANEGDILDANAPGPPVDSIGCGPAGVGLGLPFCGPGPAGTDELNSLSYGVDFTLPPPDGVHWLFFSVAPGSAGAAGSAVAGEASCIGQLPNNGAEPEADVFGTKALGSNIQNLDGDGVACNGNAAPSVGLQEQPIGGSDDLDALDEMPVSFVDWDLDGTPDAPIFFTLDNMSPSVPALMPGPGGPPSPDDVFVCDPMFGCPVMFPPMVYADGVTQLGLMPGDEIDALCVLEDGDGEYFPPMGDMIVFSLSPASPSVLAGMFSAADVLTPGGPAGPIVIAGAQQIGLMTTDDLNALKCFEEQLFPDLDGDTIPDQWEAQQTACGPLGPGDWDGDTLTDAQEYGLSTDPCKVDTDGDGCADGPTEETGANPATGGTRNPLDFYDFYDVLVPTVFWGPGGVRDQAVSILNDVLAVLEYTGTSNNGPPNGAGRDYDQDNDMNAVKDGVEYDRSVSLTGPWSGPPDGAITILTDVLLVLAQSGAICTAPPN